MNERIRELAEQAGYDHPDAIGMSAIYDHFDLEMFANLIIQSCIAQVALIGLHNIENPDIRWAIERAMDNIRNFKSDVVQQTHSEECWRWHPKCAIRKINERLP